MKIGNYIEDKVEEFRIAGKSPSYLGLSSEVMQGLAKELEEKFEFKVSDVKVKIAGVELNPYRYIEKFIGLDVVLMVGPEMPVDGVYIGTKNDGN